MMHTFLQCAQAAEDHRRRSALLLELLACGPDVVERVAELGPGDLDPGLLQALDARIATAEELEEVGAAVTACGHVRLSTMPHSQRCVGLTWSTGWRRLAQRTGIAAAMVFSPPS
jgi:hypothetical protein